MKNQIRARAENLEQSSIEFFFSLLNLYMINYE